jgi:hypothetical protein
MTRPDKAKSCLFQRFVNLLAPREGVRVQRRQRPYELVETDLVGVVLEIFGRTNFPEMQLSQNKSEKWEVERGWTPTPPPHPTPPHPGVFGNLMLWRSHVMEWPPWGFPECGPHATFFACSATWPWRGAVARPWERPVTRKAH